MFQRVACLVGWHRRDARHVRRVRSDRLTNCCGCGIELILTQRNGWRISPYRHNKK